jgi:hypothetical protein
MTKGIRFSATLFLAFSLVGAPISPQGISGQTDVPTPALVKTVRLLNTQEMSYRGKNQRFANWDELLVFIRQKNLLSDSGLDLENPKPYEVRVTTNPDATHYQITIRRLLEQIDNSHWCSTAAFSDDSGVIYLGQALDCPAAPRS